MRQLLTITCLSTLLLLGFMSVSWAGHPKRSGAGLGYNQGYVTNGNRSNRGNSQSVGVNSAGRRGGQAYTTNNSQVTGKSRKGSTPPAPAPVVAPMFQTSPPATIGPAVVQVFDQQDWPVFIGYSAGQNQGFPLTDYTGGDEGVFESPTYSGDTLGYLINGYGGVGKFDDFGGVGLTPLIAFDFNQSNPNDPATASYLVNYLRVYIDDVLKYQYTEELLQTETGNGKSDYVVPGIDLTGATSLRFVLDFGNPGGTMGDNTGGKENFFLVRSDAPQNVPEPTTILLLGLGLVGLGGLRSRLTK